MKRLCFLLVTVIVLTSAISAFALVEVECFRKTYTRLKGKPVVVSDNFTSALTTGRIVLTNGDPADPSIKRVTAARVWLNGVEIFSPSDFNDNVTEINLDIDLVEGTDSNTLNVKVEDPKDGKFSILIRQKLAFGISFAKPVDDSKIYAEPLTGIKIIRDQILVAFVESITQETIIELLNSIGANVVGYIHSVKLYQIEIQFNTSIEELDATVQYLENNPNVIFATKNYIHDIDSVFPNDSMYEDSWGEDNPAGDNWGLEAIYAPSVWGDGVTGDTNIKIGVLDRGFDINHEDLKISSNNTSYTGESILETRPALSALLNNHGTHVVGIIGAESNTIGVAGIMWKKDIYLYRPDIDTMHWIEGIEWLMKKGVKIINISMGSTFNASTALCLRNNNCPKSILDEVQKNYKQDKASATITLERWITNPNSNFNDFLIIQSAGNDNIDAKWNGTFCTIDNDTPELKEHLIVVSAVAPPSDCQTECKYNLTSDSNYGNQVDIAAPGEDILSTIWKDPNDSAKKYDLMSGTSMAAPHVTGVAGLVWNLDSSLTAQEVKKIIVNTADRNFTDERGYQYKLLNAKAAVAPPHVAAFGVQPMNIFYGDSITTFYTVFDTQGLERVELWRAEDYNGIPGIWKQITAEIVSGTKMSGSFVDTPSAGTWHYGIHVVDTDNNCTTEENKECETGTPTGGNDFGPIIVTVSAEQNQPTPPTGIYIGYLPANQFNYLYWKPVPGAVSYKVYWGTEPGVTKESEYGGDTQGDTAFSHTGVVNGYTYYYRVSSVMASGEESDLSQEVSTTVMDDFVVHFPDPVVEEEIRSGINKPAPDDIMYSDVQRVSAFAPSSSDIYNLEGLQYCSWLRWFRLFGTQQIDIHPLVGLNGVEDLKIVDCQISDIRPLSVLDGLLILTLNYNHISDISPLAGLNGLEVLNITNNQISDISSLSNLIQPPMQLDLRNNQISDISPLLSNNFLNDDRLNSLYIQDNPLSTISCTIYIPQLEQMGVYVEHSCP